MNRSRKEWHEGMLRRVQSGEIALSLMWYIPVCNGSVCRELWCHGVHWLGAVPIFHGGPP